MSSCAPVDEPLLVTMRQVSRTHLTPKPSPPTQTPPLVAALALKDAPASGGAPALLHGETYTHGGDGRTLTHYPQLDEAQFGQSRAKMLEELEGVEGVGVEGVESTPTLSNLAPSTSRVDIPLS